ncbi:TadE/TadG family type IV pilus assembly protein [Brevundimonas sp.]|uniref:TadE/TadG family type IV pilus assembly protein n=1 Tax=Brevundimonas sp. TaxID=1871086 RepID=UPI0028AD889C|nr:TadE/TadG family type IV pilus assembly protein [Brevundimonas sp.]
MMRSKARIQGRRRDGVAAVEFAIVGPVFILLLVGMIVYGAWFWMAHSVQAVVSEGARAAIAGLDAAERERLAREVVASHLKDMGLEAGDAVVEVRAEPGRFRVEVAYNAGGHPLMALAPLTVPPPRIIRRAAVIRIEES